MQNLIIVEALDKYFTDLFIDGLVEKYVQKYPDILIKKINEPSQLIENNMGQSLFESQKLLLINLQLSDWEKLLIEHKKLVENRADHWVIIISEKLKKSAKLYKKAQKNPEIIIKTIAPKTKLELEKHFIQKYNFKTDWHKKNSQKIINWFSDDSHRTYLELEKLFLMSENSQTQIDNLVAIPEAENIFQIIDGIVSGNKDSFKNIDQKISNGLDPIYLIAMLANSLRQMLLLKKYAGANLFEASKKSGIAYFIAKKYQSVLNKASFWELKRIYQKLSDYDFRIKIGKINSRVALYLLLGNLSKVL